MKTERHTNTHTEEKKLTNAIVNAVPRLKYRRRYDSVDMITSYIWASIVGLPEKSITEL
jgi:hypothetical protein